MNIFEKINKIKETLLNSKIKKSGKNQDFNYFELADITPTIINECNKLKLFTQTSFIENKAILKIINIEKPEEFVEFESPVIDFKSYKNEKINGSYTGKIIEDLTNMNSIQKLGAIQTYIRRYLFLMAFDIIENDIIDKENNKEEQKKEITTKQDQKKYTREELETFYCRYVSQLNSNTEENKKEMIENYKKADDYQRKEYYIAVKKALEKQNGGK